MDEATLKSLDSRDTTRLDKLKNTIITALKGLHYNNAESKYVRTASFDAIDAATERIRTIDRLIRSQGYHIVSDNKSTIPLKLAPFSGYDSPIHIYDFFDIFHTVCHGIKESKLSDYLYYNYITDDVRIDISHLRNSLLEMKMYLCRKYRNISKILREKRNVLRNLPQPNYKSQLKVKVTYLYAKC